MSPEIRWFLWLPVASQLGCGARGTEEAPASLPSALQVPSWGAPPSGRTWDSIAAAGVGAWAYGLPGCAFLVIVLVIAKSAV